MNIIPYSKFKHGQRVTCEIEGKKIDDAKIIIDSDGSIFICHKKKCGFITAAKFGYKYSFCIFADKDGVLNNRVTNLKFLPRTKEKIENNPDWFAPYEEKLDLRSPESEKMREEARSKRWGFVPNDSDRYYYHDLYRKTVTYNFWNCNGDNVDYSLWNMGNCHRTEEEALAWGEKYARYFLTE